MIKLLLIASMFAYAIYVFGVSVGLRKARRLYESASEESLSNSSSDVGSAFDLLGRL